MPSDTQSDDSGQKQRDESQAFDGPPRELFILLGPVATVVIFVVVGFLVFGTDAVAFSLLAGLAVAAAEYAVIERMDRNRSSR